MAIISHRSNIDEKKNAFKKVFQITFISVELDSTSHQGQTVRLASAVIKPCTFSSLDVFESHLRAGVADQHLSVKREHDVLLGEVDHAAHNVSWLPVTSERLAAHMPTLSLNIPRNTIGTSKPVLLYHFTRSIKSDTAHQTRQKRCVILYNYLLITRLLENACEYLAAIKDIGEVICAKLFIGVDIWSGPADPHLSHCHCFKLEVPLSLSHSIRFLSPEHTDLIPRAVPNMAACGESCTSDQCGHGHDSL